MSYKEPFVADQYYHVYNRAVGNEKMFITDDNYRYFLQRFTDYVLPVADVFCYALIPNHFHFFLRIKPDKELVKHYQFLKNKPFSPANDASLSDFVMEQFSNWCNSYTKSFNRMHGRKGKLFMDNMNRILIKSDSYYSTLVLYIHNNCVKHKIATKAGKWPYSSYNTILSAEPTWLNKNELLEWFGGTDQFIRFHQ